MELVKELYAYREMLFSLIKRDLRGKYKGSVLGFFWTFLNPFLQLCVYTILFSVILRSEIEKYYLFLFVALVPWMFFNMCLSGGTNVIFSQQDLVKKIYFPREILPLAYVTSNFINMLLTFIVIFGVVLFSGIGINIKCLLYLPGIMIIEYVLCLGITFLFSALTVYFRDLTQIMGIVSMAWMYMTPVLYSFDGIPVKLKKFFVLNPMTSIILAYRDILYYKRNPEVLTLLNAVIMGIFFLVIGFITFVKLKKHFVEEL